MYDIATSNHVAQSLFRKLQEPAKMKGKKTSSITHPCRVSSEGLD